VRNVYQASSVNKFHNGGSLAFNPFDHQLYLSVGDDQSSGGWMEAQKPDGTWGRILQIDTTAKIGTTAHYGLRNPYRFSFDAQNGDLYIGDVGESGTNSENVFYSKVGSPKTNFGWVGTNVRPPALDQTDAGTPIIGGIVYRGTKMPGLCGYYVYGRYNGGPIKTLKVVNGQATQVAASAIQTTTLSSLGADAAGELYFSEYTDGAIYRIDPN
jgi:glucose/arabinose dehydrogenase